MKTIKEWAEFYFKKGINICPDNVSFEWADWRLKQQTLDELKAYDWDTAKDIYAVVGKKGIRAFSLLEVENISVDYRDLLLKRTLSLLGLPKKYPWVIDFTDALCIIVESADDIQGMTNKKYKDMELLWQDTLALPPYAGCHFYFCSIPDDRPTHVSNDVLLKCINTIREDRFGRTEFPYFLGGINPKELIVLDDYCNLPLLSKYAEAERILIGVWFVRNKGLSLVEFQDDGKAVESVGAFRQTKYNRNWSFKKHQTKKGKPIYQLHVGSPCLGTLEVVYMDEHLVYAHNYNNEKVFLVKEDSIDLFKTNDDVISYLAPLENKARNISFEREGGRTSSTNNVWFKGRNQKEYIKVGCGCVTFILMMTVCAILGVGSESTLSIGSVAIGFICIVALFIVGAFVTGAFKNE